MKEHTRYQAAIIQNQQLLLLYVIERDPHRSYWAIPGGRREANESEEACVMREVLEETQLHVVVERLLFEEAGQPGLTYQRLKTYLCRPVAGSAAPGIEPEEDSVRTTIAGIDWFDLRDHSSWPAKLCQDPITFPLMQRIRMVMGYGNEC